MKAYDMGLIDGDGRLIRKPQTSEEKAQYTFFHRLVFNIKRMLNIVPHPTARKLASFASALFLLKAHTEHSEEAILEHVNLDFDCLDEEVGQTNLVENRAYQINKDIVIPIANDNVDISVPAGSSVIIRKSMGIHFGTEIFEATHRLSNSNIYVSSYDISTDLQREEIKVSVFEDSTTTADVALKQTPLMTKDKQKYQTFVVPTSIFQNFDRNRKKYQRWSTMLDLKDEAQLQIADFARKHRNSIIILQDASTGARRAVKVVSS
jgi:hypothetical protein